MNVISRTKCLLGTVAVGPCVLIVSRCVCGACCRYLLENIACNSAGSFSRFEIETLIFCGFRRLLKCLLRELRARFWGARCFLTKKQLVCSLTQIIRS